jgi:hypothetical protein
MDPEDEARMIANARNRDETEAYLLGQYTPAEQMLDTVTQRQEFMANVVHFLDFASTVDPRYLEFLHIRAEELLQKFRSL